MSNYHKPRTFRSHNGCCICKAKSSSSRFTDSEKYEMDFSNCFKVDGGRSGDICNACVLLVKRWKKLPKGSKKNWSHVVDGRSGTVSKPCPQPSKQKSKSTRDDPDLKPKKIIKKRVVSTPVYHPPKTPEEDNASPSVSASPVPSEVSENSTNSSKTSSDEKTISGLIDLSYWKRTEVCCGLVFVGSNNDVTIDMNFFKPCALHRQRFQRSNGSVSSSRSRTDTLSSHSSSTPAVAPDSPPGTGISSTLTSQLA